jgi:hypothetical protein
VRLRPPAMSSMRLRRRSSHVVVMACPRSWPVLDHDSRTRGSMIA